MQRMVDHLDDPAYIVDRELVIAAWNRAAERMFGWGAEDAIGHHADELLPPAEDWRPSRLERVRKMLASGWWAGQTGLLDRRGRPLELEGACCHVDTHTGTHYLTVLHRFSAQIARSPVPQSVTVPKARSWQAPTLVREFGPVSTIEAEEAYKYDVADRFRQARLAKGLSQEALGRLIGKSRGQVNMWENARGIPQWRNLAVIAKALDVTPGWLLTGRGDGPEE